jgi:DNA invertase Pin-like site-specific DNA recombinase
VPQRKLRFAALIRVSTEKQQKQGESLRTQESQIVEAVERHGGTIASTYAGQEHATPGFEREQVAKLLADAAKKQRPFDAVIVAHPDRWSRDNVAAEEGLRKLQEHGICFFVLTQEFDLFDPTQRFFLQMSAVVGSFQAALQKKKSIENRYHRAMRGIPTGGKPPFGRTYDRATGKWGLEAGVKDTIEQIAKRYIKGGSLPALAREFGLTHWNVHQILTEKCGPRWTNKFNLPGEGTKVAEFEIPRLLDDATIRAVRLKMDANRTYQHGKPKHQYLLSGYVFCARCGYNMTGQANPGQRLYYRHAGRGRLNDCSVQPRPWVRRDELEEVVIHNLFETFGNPKAVARAIADATPNQERVSQVRDQMKRIDKAFEKRRTAKKGILRLITTGHFNEGDGDVEKQLDALNQDDAKDTAELERLASSISNIPTPEVTKAAAEEVVRKFIRRTVSIKREIITREINSNFAAMTWEEKRDLVETVFRGHQPDGRPNGVYIEPISEQAAYRPKQWAFRLHGLMPIDGLELVMHLDKHSPTQVLPARRSSRRCPRCDR